MIIISPTKTFVVISIGHLAFGSKTLSPYAFWPIGARRSSATTSIIPVGDNPLPLLLLSSKRFASKMWGEIVREIFVVYARSLVAQTQ